MNMVETDKQELEKIWSLIKDIDVAMLTTITKEGLVSRPMQTQEVEFDGDLWFMTKKDTHKFDELKQNPSVNVAYAGKAYVSIRGTAEIVDDRDKIEQYWNIAYEKMLKTTPDDPNLVLIKIKAETAEYWEVGNWVKMAISIVNRLNNKETNQNINETIKLN